MLKKNFCNKRFSGIVWAFIVGILFFGFSIFGIKLIPTKISWYIYSSVLRIVFGFICLIILNKFLGRSIKDVLSFKNPKLARIITKTIKKFQQFINLRIYEKDFII
ncbi:MAG: hypothetical protein IJD23_08725 [Spirochaetaceae bacterium]|nr:hypothetical protein [Spirochaetaceae bacterium]